MTPYEREIERQRRLAIRRDAGSVRALARGFRDVKRTVRGNLAVLLDDIDEARAAGVTVDARWLARQRSYATLVAEARGSVVAFALDGQRTARAARKAAVADAEANVHRLSALALGDAQRETEFRRPLGSLDRATAAEILGRPYSGPVGAVFLDVVDEHSRRLTQALLAGVTTGRATRLIAEDVRIASGMTLSRVATIARSEATRAGRDAQLAVMRDAAGTVSGWTWHAARTACASCQAQHGSFHAVGDLMETHPNCRCVMVPRVPSWRELGFAGIADTQPPIETGAERFAAFTEDEQLAILGPGKFEAYRDGRITLEDLVQRTYSERWGAGTREATMAEALS